MELKFQNLEFFSKVHYLLLFSQIFFFQLLNFKILVCMRSSILEWVAVPSSRGSSQRRDRTQVCHFAGGFFTVWATELQKWKTKTCQTSSALWLLTCPSPPSKIYGQSMWMRTNCWWSSKVIELPKEKKDDLCLGSPDLSEGRESASHFAVLLPVIKRN